jgi:hypothetical protein
MIVDTDRTEAPRDREPTRFQAAALATGLPLPDLDEDDYTTEEYDEP